MTEKKYLGEILEPLDFFREPDEIEQHIENLLCRYLNMKTVIAFVGAGASRNLGYPLWGEFAQDIFSILDIFLGETEDENYLIKLITPDTKIAEEFANHLFKKKHLQKLILKIFANEKILEIYLRLLRKFIKPYYKEDSIKSLQELYKKRKADFEKNSNYIKSGHNDELDVLTIFSEYERLLHEKKEDWEKTKQSNFFRAIIGSYFQIKRITANYNYKEIITQKEHNPYLALLKLPIKKFVTFNYDLEIERALLYKNRITRKNLKEENIYGAERDKYITCEEIIKECGEKSFSQKSDYCDEMAKFSTSRFENAENMVFHCHGRIDDPNSCIVSEEDYQSWYLREEKEKFVPFRQTLDIILDSNPILFIGFGLKDADLMRTLRSIIANRSVEKTRNPLFCLLYIGKNDISEDIKPNIEKLYFFIKLINCLKLEAADKTLDYLIKITKLSDYLIKITTLSLFESLYNCDEAQKIARWKNKIEFQDECKALYTKYGLHVIPVREESYQTYNGIEGKPICNKLLELHGKWRDWWKGILTKPMFREFDLNTAEPSYFHYEFKTDENNLVKNFDSDLHSELDKALGIGKTFFHTSEFYKSIRNINKDRNDRGQKNKVRNDKICALFFALVIGDGGTGKSWSIQEYLRKKSDEGYRTFYWSSYYGNDVLTGVDRLISFFKSPDELSANSEKSKFDTLKEILNKEVKAVIVFDGVEKLLKPNKENTVGESVSPEVKEFFKIISNGNVRSRIILTSRLFPNDILLNLEEKILSEKDVDRKNDLLDAKTLIEKEKFLSAPKCWSTHLLTEIKLTNSETVNQEILSTICSLLDGHIFGISLMRGIIESIINNSNLVNQESELEIRSIIRNIANTPIEKRIDRVIKEAIDNANRIYSDKNSDKNQNKVVKKFIERIALFMHPIRQEIATVCLKEIEKEIGREINEFKIEDLLQDLGEKNLIQQVIIRTTDEPGFVVHPLVRNYVFVRLHESRFSSFPGLQLPGFTSGKETVDPGTKIGKYVAENLFNSLCNKAEEIGTEDLKKETASDMCRAAYSILRSRFCSNTVTRWGNYTAYTKMTLRLYDTAKKVSGDDVWSYKEPTRDGLIECSRKSAPLYPDELAWVYNEVGLSSLSMGNNLNATALWEQGYEISKIIDQGKENRYLFQSNLNMGGIYIYYGKLNIALDYLNKAYEIANKLENQNLSFRVAGYIALVKYLRGNLEEADKDFEETCNNLTQNHRARAFFMNCHGELLLKLNRNKEAFEKIEQSRHLAESEYYPDLISYSRLSKANYFSKEGQHINAQNEFQLVLKFSKDKHLRRLESAALSGMSRLATDLGDFATAIKLATDSLKISNEYLLSLHQTQGLIVLGKALLEGHYHKNLGIACLKTSRELAQKQEYFLRMNEAEELLAKYNVTF